MVPYKHPQPRYAHLSMINDDPSRRHASEKSGTWCVTRAFSTFSYVFHGFCRRGASKCLARQLIIFCFLLLQNMQKWVCRLDSLLSLLLSVSSQFCVWASVPRAHFLNPSHSKCMFLYCCLMLFSLREHRKMRPLSIIMQVLV